MDATLERIENFSSSSNLKIPRAKDTDRVPVHQVRADTATSVASSVTVSARKAPSITSTETKQKESRQDTPTPVTPNVRKTMLVNENMEFVTKTPAVQKETETKAVMPHESPTQAHKDKKSIQSGDNASIG